MIGRLTWTARAGNIVLPVSSDSGTISIDDQNVPAITATIVVPRDDAFLALIEPRQLAPSRLVLTGHLTEWQSVTLADVSSYATARGGTIADLSAAWSGDQIADVSRLFGAPLYSAAANSPTEMSLNLHVREVSDGPYDMVISLASDEALLTDWAASSIQDLAQITELLDGQDAALVSTYVNVVLRMVLGQLLPDGPYNDQAVGDGFEFNVLDALSRSAWDIVRPVLEDGDLKLRVNPSGLGFTLQRPENPINNPATHSWLFTDSDLTTVRHVRSRSGDWYDSAMITEDGVGGGFGYPSNRAHSRTYLEQMPEGTGVTDSWAENIVRRSINRGQFIDVTAPIIPGVFMRDEFTYTPSFDEEPPYEQWIVKSVTYDLAAATMKIRGEQRY